MKILKYEHFHTRIYHILNFEAFKYPQKAVYGKMVHYFQSKQYIILIFRFSLQYSLDLLEPHLFLIIFLPGLENWVKMCAIKIIWFKRF